MNAEEYQEFTQTTNIVPTEQEDPEVIMGLYLSAGLAGESGEVNNKMKKWHRDGVVDAVGIEKEIGDVMWYVSELCNLFGLTIEGIMTKNATKLQSRKDRGVLGGSGDDR